MNTEIFEDKRGGASNSFIRKFVTDYAFLGSYEIKYSVYLATYSGVETEQITPFTVTIAPSCPTPITLDPSDLVDQEYTLTSTSVPYTFDAYPVDPPICDITYTYNFAEATGAPVVSVFDSDSRTFTFEYDPDLNPLVDRLALYKDYTVTVTGTAGLVTSASVSQTFKLRVMNPCPSTIISLNPSPFIDETDDLGAAETTQSWDIATMSTLNTDVNCGSFDLVFYLNDGSQTPLNPSIFDDRRGAPNQFAREFVTDYAFVGSFEITYKIVLADFQTVETEQTTPFTVTIAPSCPTPITLDPSDLVDQEYTLTSTSVPYTFDAYPVDPPICDITYTYNFAEATGAPVVSVFDSDSRTFTFEYDPDLNPLVDRLALYKDYTVTVTGTAGLVTSASVSQTFKLRVMNPCPSTIISLNPSPFIDETDDLGAAETTQSWDIATMSTLNTDVNCGSFDLVFYLNDGSQTPLNPSIFDDRRGAPNQFAREFVTDYAFVGSFEITYKIVLADFQTVETEQTTSFMVTINLSCTSPVTFVPSTQTDQEYTLTDLSSDYTFDAFTVDPPICAIVYTFSISDAAGNSVVTFDDVLRTFTFDHTANLDPLINPLVASKDFTVTVTGTSGEITPVSVDVSFNLKVLNPCFDPAFVWIDSASLPTGEEYILFDFDPVTPYAFSHAPF